MSVHSMCQEMLDKGLEMNKLGIDPWAPLLACCGMLASIFTSIAGVFPVTVPMMVMD